MKIRKDRKEDEQRDEEGMKKFRRRECKRNGTGKDE